MLPTANIIQRIVFLAYGDSLGTGFTIEVDGHQYIVTAGHVVGDLSGKGHLRLNRDGKWGEVDVERLRSLSGVDVAVLDAGTVLTQTLPVAVSSDSGQHYYYGQQMFMLGFPFGEPVGNVIMADGHPMPLVKSGVLAGFYKAPAGHIRLLIDALANQGFSGGPIFCYPLDRTLETRIVGVVTDARVDWQPVRKADGPATDLEARYHAHITLGEDIAYALDDIAAHRQPVSQPM